MAIFIAKKEEKLKLIITEKPSVAQTIAKVIGANQRKAGYLEGNGYLVSWCVGHLIELAEPEAYNEKYSKWRYEDLPIFPEAWKYQVTASTKKQYAILKELMFREAVESIVEATDAGREGELIFRLVYNQCKCKKPFERLWISSMEDEAILKGFSNLKPGKEYDALYEAALCRERADWLVGINTTRLFSTLYGQTLNVGRVMTPTLAMVVEREAAIAGFMTESFYTVTLKIDGITVTSERMPSQEQAEILQAECQAVGQVRITKVEKKEKQEKAPNLFDLTSLQREANRRLGYTAQQTLDYTQSLYEKKLVSYPRTDSRFLTEDMEATVPELLEKIRQAFKLEATVRVDIARVVNGKKVTDHHAIIPTRTIANVELSELPAGEKEILKLIATRLAEAVSAPCRYSEIVVEAECANYKFQTQGKQILESGWKQISSQKAATSTNEENDESCISYEVMEGQILSITEVISKEGKTKPKAHFTEDTLLSAMERAGSDEAPEEVARKGLGTSATRAGIIEKLVRIGFIERKGDKKTKYLIPTHKGIALITVIPEAIQSPSMTAEWEEKLLKIEKREYELVQFSNEINELITTIVSTYQMIQDAEVLIHPVSEAIGKCPCCGNEVVEKIKGFFCSNKECGFALWKSNRFFDSLSKVINRQVAEKLLVDGRAKLKKCRCVKTGKTYDTTVIMKVDAQGRAEFSLDFSKGGK